MNLNSYFEEVQVHDAPGYEDFEGNLMMTYPAVDDRGDLAVILDDLDKTVYVIPMKYVTQVTPT